MKAERIYDKKQDLQSVKDYLLKLDVKRDSANPDAKEFQELDSRSSDIEQSVESWKANRQHGK